MAIFGRRRRADRSSPPLPPVHDPDPVLPVLSRADAALLDQLARAAFAAAGVEATSDGEGVLTAMDGQQYGLTNLAAGVAGAPRSQWQAVVASHVEGMVAAHDVPEPQSFDEVRDQVHVRLRWAADLPFERPSYAPEAMPGVLEVVAIDYPSHVAEQLRDAVVQRLGGWADLRAQGLHNLRRLPPLHHEVVEADPERDDAAVHVLTGDDFFVPSRVLVLEELLAGLRIGPAPHGVLLTVPHRHLLALHPLSGVGAIAAMTVLVRIGQGEFATQPGALSPHVYYRPAGVGAPIEQVTWPGEDGATAVRVDGALADAFAALGLIG